MIAYHWKHVPKMTKTIKWPELLTAIRKLKGAECFLTKAPKELFEQNVKFAKFKRKQKKR